MYFIFEYCSYDLYNYIKKFKKKIKYREIQKIMF